MAASEHSSELSPPIAVSTKAVRRDVNAPVCGNTRGYRTMATQRCTECSRHYNPNVTPPRMMYVHAERKSCYH